MLLFSTPKIQLVFFLICCVTYVALLPSCDSVSEYTESNQQRYQNLVDLADKLLKTNADSAIFYADSAINMARTMPIESDQRFPPFLTRANALLQKGLSDSACAVMELDRTFFYSISDSLSLAKASGFLAIQEMNKGRLLMAEKRLIDALKLYKNLNKVYEQAQILQRYGVLLTRRGEFKKSQDYLFQALQFTQFVDSVRDIGTICHNIGNNYADMGNPAEAMKYYRIAEQTAIKTSSFESQIKALINIGILYRKSKPDSALYYYEKALEIEKRYPNKRLYINALYNIANIHQERHELSQAVGIYQEVLDFCSAEKLYSGQIRAYRGLAEAYGETGDFSKAILYMGKALALSDSAGETSSSTYYMDKLALFYEKTGNYTKANQLIRKINILKDSLQKKDKLSSFKELEILNKIQYKELEYDHVKKELEHEKRMRLLRLLIIAILGISTIFLGLSLFRSYRLLQERRLAYTVLMEAYEKDRIDMESRLKLVTHEAPDAHTDTSDSEIAALISALVKYYNEDKPYLDPKLKLETVVHHLSTTEKDIAAALKAYGNYNFNSFTNHFRVEASKKMMEDPRYRNYKIEAIAEASGFGTRMSFYNAFGQQTGVRPSYFRNYVTNKERKISVN
jgi:tetratricopeptide (TPR) repeat protein